jgi:endonuclease G
MEESAKRTNRIFAKTPKLKDEILEAAAGGRLSILAKLGISKDTFEAALTGRRSRNEGLEGISRGSEMPGGSLEAIVRVVGRPPLLIKDGTYEKPPTESLRKKLEPHRKRINAVVASVGRVEFRFHRVPWGGTGWMIDEKIMVTNRHVAELVAEADRRGGFRFKASPISRPYEAKIDYLEEKGGALSKEAKLARVRFIAALNQPDIALFEVEPGDFKLPPPIPLGTAKKIALGMDVGVVGYPADDPDRNDPDRIAAYFGDIFDVKRFAAGEVTQIPDDGVLMHDATTLGGNSGSVVFDLASGQAVGLHFAGEYQVGNFAVDADTIKKVLAGLKTVVTGTSFETEKRDSTHKADFFKGRDGYTGVFLGKEHEVALPGLGPLSKDVAEATEADGTKTKILKYRHFSVQFSKSRKLPIYTAVNIDGEQSRRIKRGDDQWCQDLRLPKEIQLGEKDYGRKVIDRGHMVRREDPVWGGPDEATEANFDTFHYTNAAPQHADLNQRANSWQGLENFILENSRTKGLKVTVFTGPVLRKDDPSDPDFPSLGQIPREFWKVIAAIDSETDKLYATGFVLSQGKMIADFTEAIVFGDWNSYQVPISMIAKATGLDFSQLEKVDTIATKPKPKPKPKKGKKALEGVAAPGPAVILLNSPQDVYLGG